jgi:predicted O-methyltransferase YrrM
VQYVRQTGIKDVASLEIGTLFGGSCLMKLFAIRNLGCAGTVTCIDPMAGYYGREHDPASKFPVNSEIFYANIKKFGFSEQDVKLIAEMSNSPNAFKELKEKSYATLLIDGDHSYDGVKYDWSHYNKYITEGGFVLFDDYNERVWPDVTKFVKQEIESLSPGWKVCGTVGTTFVLQRALITER